MVAFLGEGEERGSDSVGKGNTNFTAECLLQLQQTIIFERSGAIARKHLQILPV